MKPFHFIPLKYQDFGEEEVEFRTEKAFLKNVKNILVLNVAFSKSVLVLIKKMSVSSYGVLMELIFNFNRYLVHFKNS